MPSIRSLGLGAVTLLHLLAPVDALRGRGVCSASTRFSALGCYVDNEDGRALTGPSFQNEGMTVKACRRACSSFEYFGVENAVYCFCGDALTASTAGVGECNLPCGGNATETCGGVNRLDVFKKDGLILSSTLSSGVASSTAPPSSAGSISASVPLSSALSTTSEHVTSTISSTEIPSSSPSSLSSSWASSSSPSSPPASSSSSSSSSSSLSSSLSSSSSSPAVSTTTSTTPTTSTTSASSVPSTTSTTSTTPTTTSTTTSTTSTTSQCPLTTSMVAGTAPCWGSIPPPCTTLTSNLPSIALSSAATSCQRAFVSASTVHPSVSSCFSALSQPTFSPQSAYTCVSNAGPEIYCPTTVKCVPTTLPPSTNLVTNGNFNFGSGNFTPWALSVSSGLGEPSITVAVNSERSRSLFSLKVYYNNADPGGERRWAQPVNGLVPGVQYELSYYWYQNFGQTRLTSYIGFSGPEGVSPAVVKEFSHFNTGAGVWTKVTETFVPGASFGNVVLGVRMVKGGGPGTLYFDDVTIKRLAW